MHRPDSSCWKRKRQLQLQLTYVKSRRLARYCYISVLTDPKLQVHILSSDVKTKLTGAYFIQCPRTTPVLIVKRSAWCGYSDQWPAHKADATNTGRDRHHSQTTTRFLRVQPDRKQNSFDGETLRTLTGLLGRMSSKVKTKPPPTSIHISFQMTSALTFEATQEALI